MPCEKFALDGVLRLHTRRIVRPNLRRCETENVEHRTTGSNSGQMTVVYIDIDKSESLNLMFMQLRQDRPS